jgi:hypothetical protein
MIYFLKAFTLVILLASAASAQSAGYVDHRTYPADLSIVQPGDPVADRPGFVWRHDGVGWYHQLATVSDPGPMPVPPMPPTVPADCVPFNAYGQSSNPFSGASRARHSP